MAVAIGVLILFILYFIYIYDPASFETNCDIINNTEERDDCYLSKVTRNFGTLPRPVSSEDAAFCDKINSTAVRDECYLLASNSFPALCKKISLTTEVYEIQTTPERVYQVNFSEYFPYKEMESKARDVCPLWWSHEREHVYTVDCCLFDVIYPRNKNHSWCEDFSTTPWQDYCYLNTAINQKVLNISICDKITHSCKKEMCKAIVSGDHSSCEKISECRELFYAANGDTDKDLCYYEIAVRTNNSALCENISGSNEVFDCYEEIALKTKNAELCEHIDDVDDKGNCYQEIARKTHNKTLCNEIPPESRFTKEYCYSVVR